MTFFPSPLGGNLGANTATVYKLDPTLTAPLEPMLDLVPGLLPFRVTVDLIDSESKVNAYNVTRYPVQFGGDITTHVKKELKALNLTTTLGATIPVLAGGVLAVPTAAGLTGLGGELIPNVPIGNDFFIPKMPPVPGSTFRMDLVRLKHLEEMADDLMPVMIVTPRIAMAQAFFTNVTHNWTPALGLSTQITMSFLEANIVSPFPKVADATSTAVGNTAGAGGGTSAATEVGQGSTASATPGAAPSLGTSPPAGRAVGP